eukprot:CAMPEP_0115866638 /NCGR_PEP_ID=MMETSP0287-20121206/20353_1 /TAXON_ID=412157 /ORGANISM="Chrysochromulina rotalis, Strain UIO044" /LENGTH=253 /DNA_ID=CAMNT_0003321213 /DNA_START=41 /DNA_END=802 /DNA_ORIENTATION=-
MSSTLPLNSLGRANSVVTSAEPLLTLEETKGSRCRARRCCCFLSILLLGFVLGSCMSFWLALTYLVTDPPTLPDPFIPECGACSSALEGQFTALVTEDAPAGGVEYDITHTFYAKNGTADVLLKVHHSPASMLPDFACYDVPFAVDPNGCNMTIGDACLTEAYKKSFVIGMYLTWDGGGNLSVVEDINVPVLGVSAVRLDGGESGTRMTVLRSGVWFKALIDPPPPKHAAGVDEAIAMAIRGNLVVLERVDVR